MTATNEEILGRTDANDLEAILAITNDDMDSVRYRPGYDFHAARFSAAPMRRCGFFTSCAAALPFPR